MKKFVSFAIVCVLFLYCTPAFADYQMMIEPKDTELRNITFSNTSSPLHVGDTATGSNDWVRINATFNQPRPHSSLGTSHHLGVDLKTYTGNATQGRPVWNIYGNGEVSGIGYDSIYGNYVMVKHKEWDGAAWRYWYSFYAHLYTASVSNGQTGLTRSTKIGISGTTGSSTGVHLHLEFRHVGTGHRLPPALFYYNIVNPWGNDTSYGNHLAGRTANEVCFRFKGFSSTNVFPPKPGSVILHYCPAGGSWNTTTMTSSDGYTFYKDFSGLVPRGTSYVDYWVEAQDNSWGDGTYRKAYRPYHYYGTTPPPTSVAFRKYLTWTSGMTTEPPGATAGYFTDPLPGTPYVENPSPEVPAHLNIQGTATLLEQVSRNIWKARDIITGKIYYLLIDPKIPQAKYLGVGVTVKFVGAEIEAGSLPGPAIDATNGEFFEVLLPDFE